MSLMNDFDNMLDYVKGKNRSPKFKDLCIEKFNKLYNMSEKLFDKIYEKDCTETDITIIQKMITYVAIFISIILMKSISKDIVKPYNHNEKNYKANNILS